MGDVLAVHILKTKQNLADVASDFTFSNKLLLCHALKQFATGSPRIKYLWVLKWSI
jgi:hypothetical protein